MCASANNPSAEAVAHDAFFACRLWSSASPDEIAELWRVTRVREYSRGDVLFREGEAGDEFAFVVDGHLRGVHIRHEGRLLGIRSAWPGEFMGSYLAVAPGAYTDDIVAEEPSLVCLVRTAGLAKLLRSNSAVAMAMLRHCGEIIAELLVAVHTAAADVPSRVANYILECAGGRSPDRPAPFEVDLRIGRVELALALGTAPETLSRTFALLASENVVTSSGGQVITILDDAALAVLAENS